MLMVIFSPEESLENGPEGGPNFAEILNKALPDSTDHSFCDSGSEQGSNSGEVSGEESVIVGQSAQVMSGTQGPPRPPVIIHTLAPSSLLYYQTNTAAHDNLSPPSPIC